MSNFSKEKNHAIIMDSKRGPCALRIPESKLKTQLDSYIHDVVEGYFEALPLLSIAGQDDLILLVNDDAIRLDMQLNPWATLLFHREIFGDAIILKRKGTELEALTKEEVLDIVLILRR